MFIITYVGIKKWHLDASKIHLSTVGHWLQKCKINLWFIKVTICIPNLFWNGCYCMIPSIRNVQNRQIYGDRQQTDDCLKLGCQDGRKCGVVINGYGFSLGGDVWNGLKLDSGDDCTTLWIYKNSLNCTF